MWRHRITHTVLNDANAQATTWFSDRFSLARLLIFARPTTTHNTRFVGYLAQWIDDLPSEIISSGIYALRLSDRNILNNIPMIIDLKQQQNYQISITLFKNVPDTTVTVWEWDGT